MLSIRKQKRMLSIISAILENLILNEHPIVLNHDEAALVYKPEDSLDTF
jgi:hypothetical protein